MDHKIVRNNSDWIFTSVPKVFENSLFAVVLTLEHVIPLLTTRNPLESEEAVLQFITSFQKRWNLWLHHRNRQRLFFSQFYVFSRHRGRHCITVIIIFLHHTWSNRVCPGASSHVRIFRGRRRLTDIFKQEQFIHQQNIILIEFFINSGNALPPSSNGANR